MSPLITLSPHAQNCSVCANIGGGSELNPQVLLKMVSLLSCLSSLLCTALIRRCMLQDKACDGLEIHLRAVVFLWNGSSGGFASEMKPQPLRTLHVYAVLQLDLFLMPVLCIRCVKLLMSLGLCTAATCLAFTDVKMRPGFLQPCAAFHNSSLGGAGGIWRKMCLVL